MRFDPHPFTLRQLQYVVAVAEELSFRKAAARCHVAQPSLSAQIAQVEAAAGVQIFERSQRKVLVTPAGNDIVDRARKLLLEADDLREAGRRGGDPLTGTLRLGVIPTIAPYLLPIAAPELRARFRRLTVAWREEKTGVLMEALHRGALDAALVALESDLGDVDWETVAHDPFVLALRANHPLAKGKIPIEPSDLHGQDVLLLDEGHCFRDQALEVCSVARTREGEFRATSLTTLVQMVAGGGAVTLLPTLAVATEARRAGLKVRPMASADAQRTIALVWRGRSPLGPALREVARALRDAYPAKNTRSARS
jgi:LysR family transcriptional regulator, hydrogen peroxide-inducible genes activator